MKDGGMFAKLEQYELPELYQKEPYFYIYIPGKVLRYQIFPVTREVLEAGHIPMSFQRLRIFKAFCKQSNPMRHMIREEKYRIRKA